MRTNMHGLIFAHQKTPALSQLVSHRTLASVPYAGRYRLIDFSLSSLVNSGVTDIGVIMQQGYQSLINHIGTGKDWDIARRVGGLRLLPPFSYSGESPSGYRGRMEALSGIVRYLDAIRQDYVVLCEGSLIGNIAYEDVLSRHIDSGRQITAVCSLTSGAPNGFDDYFTADESGRATAFFREASPERTELEIRSLNSYIISKKLLLELVKICAEKKLYSFSKDVIAAMFGELDTGVYVHRGYTAVIRTLEDYYKSSMDLLGHAARTDLFRHDRTMRTAGGISPSAYYGSNSKVENSLIADGCRIEGEVSGSILFRGVQVEKGACVRNSIVMDGSVIRAGAVLDCVIIDKDVTVTEGRSLSGSAGVPVTVGKELVI